MAVAIYRVWFDFLWCRRDSHYYINILYRPSVFLTNDLVVDSYFPVAFEMLLLSSGLKNVFAFGFAYGVVPWIAKSGYSGAFGEMAAIQVGVMLFGLPLWYWGKQIRHASASWKVVCW
jgi:hypothetical protein